MQNDASYLDIIMVNVLWYISVEHEHNNYALLTQHMISDHSVVATVYTLYALVMIVINQISTQLCGTVHRCACVINYTVRSDMCAPYAHRVWFLCSAHVRTYIVYNHDNHNN